MLKSWLASRWRVIAVVLAVVLGLVAATIVTVAVKNAESSVAEEFDCTQLEEASFDLAGPKARACDAEVEVVSERTPWQTTWATPDETTRLEISTMPSRTSVSGEWTPLDTTIEGTPGEGVLEVAAPVYPIELNAGGLAGEGDPLGSITRDGKRLDVWFPTPLPVPTVEDSRLQYDLAEGVRLFVSVSVNGTGFLPVVELADWSAADRFRQLLDAARPSEVPGKSGDLVFTTGLSDGLRLVPEEQGSVLVVDDEEKVSFVASPPVMWDSAGGRTELPDSVTEVSETDRTRSPAPGDTIKLMPTAVDGTRIVVSPATGMLTGADTVWPVYVDPGFNAHPWSENVAIRTGGYTGTLYNWRTVGGEGAGYCTDTATCNVVFKQRLVWEYAGLSEITALTSADVISAGFTVYGTHSASCAATTTDLHMLAGISPSTTWGSLEWADYNRIDSRTEYHSVGCGNTGWRTYNATSAAKQFADNDSWTTLSLGLKARDESTMTSWKRFGNDATLSVEYNRRPFAPTDPTLIEPADRSGCTTGTGRPWINTTTPRMSAIGSDPDGGSVNVRFELARTNSSVLLWDQPAEPWDAASGTRFSSKVSPGILENGGTYSWRAKVGDWIVHGPYTLWCEFAIDLDVPVKPSIAPVGSGADMETVYVEGVERGGVGLKGKFLLGPAGSTDVVKYTYRFGSATPTTVTVPMGGTHEVPFTPTASGPTTLFVTTTDRAGNVSPERSFSFTVASPVEDVIWKLDENAGASTADSGPKGAGPLTVAGAGWVAGPHQLFGSRSNDWALKFDGVNDAATSAGPVVDTSKSFTVSAHVLLDSTKLGSGDFTALSQDGLTQSGFRLGYRSNCDGARDDCWSFSMPDSSAGSAVVSATSTVVTADQWVHLVGEHDASAKTVRLWVCEVGTPAQPAVGEPVGSAPVTRAGAAWKSPGAFVVGRGLAGGVPVGWWPGTVDNVRVFSGQVTDASKLRRLCQGAEAEDFGQGTAGFNAVDPTVSEQ